ncbi:ATPase P [candidate division KSB1 bacterium]|nr:ATPase P [candidate division KSB1 bacterium]
MIRIDIPGLGKLELKHLVLDYNGTLACDGILLDGVAQRLEQLKNQLEIHVVTADTFGTVAEQLEHVTCAVHVLERDQQDVAKLRYVERLGATHTVCIGNGRNDRRMLAAAALGIAIVQEEGLASVTWQAADVIMPTIIAALDLLLKPNRLVATLRI